jgi:hypothetical protein
MVYLVDVVTLEAVYLVDIIDQLARDADMDLVYVWNVRHLWKVVVGSLLYVYLRLKKVKTSTSSWTFSLPLPDVIDGPIRLYCSTCRIN